MLTPGTGRAAALTVSVFVVSSTEDSYPCQRSFARLSALVPSTSPPPSTVLSGMRPDRLNPL
jgi:hypothetical protein